MKRRAPSISCDALAAGLRLPRLRHEQSMGTANQIVDMGMRQLRSSDLGDRRDDHAPLQAAADHLVLGSLSDGHPLQRHFGPAIATPARLGIVPQCLVALWQAAPEMV